MLLLLELAEGRKKTICRFNPCGLRASTTQYSSGRRYYVVCATRKAKIRWDDGGVVAAASLRFTAKSKRPMRTSSSMSFARNRLRGMRTRQQLWTEKKLISQIRIRMKRSYILVIYKLFYFGLSTVLLQYFVRMNCLFVCTNTYVCLCHSPSSVAASFRLLILSFLWTV